MSDKKKVLIVTTGGTIAMSSSLEGGGVVPKLSGEELVNLIPEIKEIADIDLVEFANIPSPSMTIEMLENLSKLVKENIANYDGVVITHGTDTVEETAYFLYLTVETDKPIVFTAAMRSNEESGLDGPRNLLNAVRVVCCSKAKKRDVMLTVNDEIFCAREVYKSSTSLVNAFDSPNYGKLGIIDVDRVIFYRKPERRYKYNVEKVEARVDLIKLCLDLDRKFVDLSISSGVKGIVIEAFGRGNVNPAIKDAIVDAINAGIVVVISSRVPNGRVLGVYGYEGGAKQLESLGAIMANDLNSEKARLKLMVLLGAKKSEEEIREIFNDDIID